MAESRPRELSKDEVRKIIAGEAFGFQSQAETTGGSRPKDFTGNEVNALITGLGSIAIQEGMSSSVSRPANLSEEEVDALRSGNIAAIGGKDIAANESAPKANPP